MPHRDPALTRILLPSPAPYNANANEMPLPTGRGPRGIPEALSMSRVRPPRTPSELRCDHSHGGYVRRNPGHPCQHSLMASTTCAYCGRLSHMSRQWSNFTKMNTLNVLQGVATCDECGRASVASRILDSDEGATGSDAKFDSSRNLQWQPLKVLAPHFSDVPQAIARAAQEAHQAESIGAMMAAILMARTVVEATAKNKGITKGHLVAKIDELAKQGFIRDSTRGAAHEIRHFGNDMAHGDIEEMPTSEDVADVLSLMDEVLNEVFQGPARTARVKARRTTPAAVEEPQ